MSYYNYITKKEQSQLPTTVETSVGIICGATPSELKAEGWVLTEVMSFIVPDGYVIIPDTRTIHMIGDTAQEMYDAETISAKEDREASEEASSEIEFQNNKSPMLKTLENIYVDFLTNMWSPLLREKGIISQNDIITVDNTDSTQNITYLMQLRFIDFSKYGEMAGEFERLKNTIISMGGVMDKIKTHSL